MAIKKITAKHKVQGKNKKFWDKEYTEGGNLALSTEPGDDMLKFVRSLERNSGREFLNPLSSVLDLGCGNGRHVHYMAETYGMRGIGYDISKEAIEQAQARAGDLPLYFEARSIEGVLDVPDSSTTMVFDLMASHFLKAEARDAMLFEILRVLKPGGWYLWKTFLADGDLHTKRLLRDHPGEEEGSYVHPTFGMHEHVWREKEAKAFLDPYFNLVKIEKSHRHLDKQGRANKRRTITIYAQKM